MNYLDIIVIVPVLWFMYKGFKNGLIKEIASLAALLFGLWIAVSFSHYLEVILEEKTNIDENYLPLLAFALVFILVVVLINLLSKALNKLVKAISLEWLNKTCGIVFGGVKAIIILSAILFLVNQFLVIKLGLISEDVLSKSMFYSPLSELIEFIYPKLENVKFEALQFV